MPPKCNLCKKHHSILENCKRASMTKPTSSGMATPETMRQAAIANKRWTIPKVEQISLLEYVIEYLKEERLRWETKDARHCYSDEVKSMVAEAISAYKGGAR